MAKYKDYLPGYFFSFSSGIFPAFKFDINVIKMTQTRHVCRNIFRKLIILPRIWYEESTAVTHFGNSTINFLLEQSCHVTYVLNLWNRGFLSQSYQLWGLWIFCPKTLYLSHAVRYLYWSNQQLIVCLQPILSQKSKKKINVFFVKEMSCNSLKLQHQNLKKVFLLHLKKSPSKDAHNSYPATLFFSVVPTGPKPDKSQFLLHKNCSPCNLCIMNLVLHLFEWVVPGLRDLADRSRDKIVIVLQF